MMHSLRTLLALTIIGKDVRLASLCWLEALRLSNALPDNGGVLAQTHTVSNNKGKVVYELAMYRQSKDGGSNG